MFNDKPSLPESLHICYVAQKFPMLGRAADYGFLWPIAKGLAKKGHKVTILSWKNPQRKPLIEQEGVRAHFVGEIGNLGRKFSEVVNDEFKTIHKNDPIHIVHSIDASGVSIGKRKKHYRIAMAYDVDATQMAQLFSILGMAQESLGSLLRTAIAVCYKFLTTYYSRDQRIIRTADGIFVTSPQQKLILERHYLYPELKTYTVPYGIDLGDLTPRESSNELKELLKIPGNSKVVVTFSDMTELEEVKNVLKAFELVAIKKPSARLVIVGNGPLRESIEFEMLQLALGSKVIFTGAIKNTEIPDYVSLADVFVNISSRTSGFEANILEAMAQKKVIIGSEVSPISTIVEDGVEGFLIRPADRSTLAGLIIKVFDGQLDSSEIGERASTKVTNLFNLNNMVDETIDAYYKILRSTKFYQKSTRDQLKE